MKRKLKTRPASNPPRRRITRKQIEIGDRIGESALQALLIVVLFHARILKTNPTQKRQNGAATTHPLKNKRGQPGEIQECHHSLIINLGALTKTIHMGKSSSFDLVGAYVNPHAPQDITFHLEIEATEDLEEDLESFSRLRRLGQFTAAVNHFRRRLLNSLDNTYVLVQYGQFLLESSDVNGLSQLAEKFAAKQYNTHLAVDEE
ncbi:hypothetical protein K456DRAFT_1716338 [Colletotrichum gloeosporioides 23]|nr:hypothetical protein K456DRAFT_1716338 [Colletotrichum gloeosporioides 23]